MSRLSYPKHFLHDIENMSDEQRAERTDELIRWCKRYADGNANPKWVENHMFELSRLAERLTARVAELEATLSTINIKAPGGAHLFQRYGEARLPERDL